MPGEIEIIYAALQGDVNAFRSLVDAYQQPVYLVVLGSVRDPIQAQDLAQETFVRAYLNLEQLREPAKFGAWICGIARNVARKWLERSHPHVSLEDHLERNGMDLKTEAPLPEERLRIEQTRQRLWQAIYALPETLREVVALFYMRGMKRQEIAQFLDITEGAVRNRLHKARQILKEELSMDERQSQNTQLPEDFTDKVIAEAMRQGEMYLQEREWQQARHAFLRAADVQQDYAPAYRGVGLAARGQILQQLDGPEGALDRSLLEEALAELSRAYRLGARDWDTISALGGLYEQFDRGKEAADAFWNHAQQVTDVQEAFKAQCEAIRILSYRECLPDEQILERHRQMLAESAGKVPERDRFDTFWRILGTYKRAGRAEEWLRESERIGLPIRDELWMHPWTVYTCYRCQTYAWDLDQKEHAMELAEEFLDYARNHPLPHPYRRVAMLDIYAMPLLSLYWGQEYHTKEVRWTEKLQAAFADIDQILEGYEGEYQEMKRRVGAMSEVELQEWDALATHFNSGYGNELGPNRDYPVGGDKEAVEQWLDITYQSAMEIALHQIGCGFAWIGQGERAIACFLRKRNQDSAEHNMFLAEWMWMFRNDRDAALEYVKRAARNRRAAARGYLKWRFFENGQFGELREDPDFVAVISADV